MTHPFVEARWGLGPGTPPWHPPPSAGLKGGPNDSTDDVWVVVLAGGQGTRLQQFIRLITGSDRPKQFCRIVGMRTMLRHTWDRACRIVPPDRVVTVITAGQECHLRDEPSGSVPGQILVQPANKETGPGR